MKNKPKRQAGKPSHKVVSKPLLHPPLSEVAFEVNFPNSFAVETGIADYQRRVEALYPNSGAEYVVRLPSGAAFGKPSKQDSTGLKPMRSFVFQTMNSARIVRVSVVNFTLQVTDYLHFEDYKSALVAALMPAIEIFHLHGMERIGLRYVNQIKIPNEEAEIRYKEFVRSPIDASAFSSHTPTNFLTEVSMDLEGAKKLTIRSGLLPPQADSATRTYLLDLDCYSVGNVIVSGDGLTKLLDDYHEAIEAEFIHVVTDKYWKYMAEGKSR
jgi:uncharacterized protein (TIGR04255 family)